GVFGSQNYLVDTLISDGKSAVEYRAEKPLEGGLYYFVLPDGKSFFQFLLDKDQQFTLHTEKGRFAETMRVEGSLDNELLYENLRFEAKFRTRVDSVENPLKTIDAGNPNKAYLENLRAKLVAGRQAHLANFFEKHPESFFSVFKKAGQNPELEYPKTAEGKLDTTKQVILYRNAYFKGTDLADERLLRTPVVFNKLKTYITQLVPQSTDSINFYADKVIAKTKGCEECFKFAVNWIAIQYEKPKMMGGEAILVHLVDTYFTDELAFWYEDNPKELKKIRKKVNEMRPSMLGKTGQDLRCKNIAGEYESLYDLKTPYKIVFMYSYSCSHCKERAPLMPKLLEEWK
ncbi:MAG: DUF5106 domain-containing protein, partial [Bacteroidota bacterium]